MACNYQIHGATTRFHDEAQTCEDFAKLDDLASSAEWISRGAPTRHSNLALLLPRRAISSQTALPPRRMSRPHRPSARSMASRLLAAWRNLTHDEPPPPPPRPPQPASFRSFVVDALSYLTFRPVGGWAALQAPISPLRPHLFAFAVCIAAYYLARTILRRRHRSRLAGLLSPLPQPAAALAQVDSHVLRALREASPDLAGRWLGDDPGGWAEGVALDGSGRRVESLRLEWLAELTCLPAEIGRLSALCSLSLSGCERLEGLPPEIGRLKCLARLSLAGCERLASLPPELGGLASLAVLNLYGCEQLEALPLELTRITSLTTLNLVGCVCLTSPPPETHAYPARQLLAAIAREACSEILDSDTIVQPTAALSDALCLHVVTDDASAPLLGAAVQAKPWIAELTSSTGERAIDLASLPCRRAMQAALYLLGRFEVVRGPPLHFSATSAVLAADDHADREVRHRRCLKAMHGQAQARVAPPCPTTLCVWRNLPYLTLPYLTLP